MKQMISWALALGLATGCSGSTTAGDGGNGSDVSQMADGIAPLDSSPGSDAPAADGRSDVLPTDVTTGSDVPARVDSGTTPDVVVPADVVHLPDVVSVPDTGVAMCPASCTTAAQCIAACPTGMVGEWCCQSNTCVITPLACVVTLPDAGSCTGAGQCRTAADCPMAGAMCCPSILIGGCGTCEPAHSFCPG